MLLRRLLEAVTSIARPLSVAIGWITTNPDEQNLHSQTSKRLKSLNSDPSIPLETADEIPSDCTTVPNRDAGPSNALPLERHSAGTIVSSFDMIIHQRPEWAPTVNIPNNKLSFNGASSQKPSKWSGVVEKSKRAYRYTPIDSDHTRLAIIKHGEPHDEMRINMITVSDDLLGSKSCQYATLSYCWGNGPNDKAVHIRDSRSTRTLSGVVLLLNEDQESTLQVGSNLFEALVHLRKKHDDFVIWVDALCINQMCNEEKNVQVSKMAMIYRKAYNVNIWLGVDEPNQPVASIAMPFIREMRNPHNYKKLLKEEKYIKCWASVFQLLKWSWFSRRWIIQEIAFAQQATVHSGNDACRWDDFATAISVFCENSDTLKPKLIAYFRSINPSLYHDDSMFEIKQLCAIKLVDMKVNLFRVKRDNTLESTIRLENLVYSLACFETSDPRDAVNTLINISRESNHPGSAVARALPRPDYRKDLFEVNRDFVKFLVETSGSLDILCRQWALKERKTRTPTTPRLVTLPSWIKFAADSAYGMGEDRFNGRAAGDQFVGPPDTPYYCASGRGAASKQAVFSFPPSVTINPHAPSSSAVYHDMSLTVRGIVIGTISYRTDPIVGGVIPSSCLQKLGCSPQSGPEQAVKVPDQLWRTLVADRDANGKPTPPWYKSACEHMLQFRRRDGHVNINSILNAVEEDNKTTHSYLQRVIAVTYDRCFLEGTPTAPDDTEYVYNTHEKLVGFGPSDTETGDIIAIVYGVSVPVILRPVSSAPGEPQTYHFLGEAYIYGKMDGEAFDEDYQEHDFKLI